jgi:hypothetical protein
MLRIILLGPLVLRSKKTKGIGQTQKVKVMNLARNRKVMTIGKNLLITILIQAKVGIAPNPLMDQKVHLDQITKKVIIRIKAKITRVKPTIRTKILIEVVLILNLPNEIIEIEQGATLLQNTQIFTQV